MTTGNESDPRDDVLARAWSAQSQEVPPPALDATILAAAHRAVGSGPRDAGKQAMEATRPQRWWMPLAAAATIGVVAIGILQIAPQAPVDILVGERADVAGRVAPVVPAAPAKDMAQGNVIAPLQETAPGKNVEQATEPPLAKNAERTKERATAKSAEQTNVVASTTTAPSTSVPAPMAREKKAAKVVASAPPPSASPSALTDARKQVAVAPSIPAPEPFPADKLSSKADAQAPARQNDRKDVAGAPSAPAPYNEAATRSEARVPSARLAAPAPAPAAPPAQSTMAAPPPAPAGAAAQSPMAAPPAPLAAPAPMAPSAPMVAQAPGPAAAPATAMMAPAPMKKESMAGASGSLAAGDSAAKPAAGARERDTSRDETSVRNAPAAASSELARGVTGPIEWQARARDPDAWIARIRKLRVDGRVAEAVAELREFRRYVPNAESRLPADLRQLAPMP